VDSWRGVSRVAFLQRRRWNASNNGVGTRGPVPKLRRIDILEPVSETILLGKKFHFPRNNLQTMGDSHDSVTPLSVILF
jgi:hypothetical protein